MSYKLNIKLTDEALETIARAGEKVVLVKHTAGNSDTVVSWVAFKPWQNNTVEWKDDFAIYASNTQIDDDAIIQKLSEKEAVPGVCYPFSDGYFHSPIEGKDVLDNCYVIRNDDKELDGVTVGLAQNVIVNGEAYENNPMNAVYVPRGQYATMTPIERIDIYLRNDSENGTVLSGVCSVPLTVTYDENESTHTVGYNSINGTFYLEE